MIITVAGERDQDEQTDDRSGESRGGQDPPDVIVMEERDSRAL